MKPTRTVSRRLADMGASVETDAVAQSRRAGRARRHLTINPAEDRTRRSRGVDRGRYVRDASSRADRPRRRLLRSPQHRCRSAVFDGDTAITGPPVSEYSRVELDWRGRTVLDGGPEFHIARARSYTRCIDSTGPLDER